MKPSSREETLFQAAVALTADERAAFLDRECAGDPALRARIDALLAAHDQPDTLFGTEAVAPRPTISLDLARDLSDDLVGETIGRYKLLEKIGEGGCGVVYVAEQTEPVRRRVASRTSSVICLLILPCLLRAATILGTDLTRPDWPMYGGGPTRNAIRAGTNPPTRWGLERMGEDLRPGLNIKWLARTGHGFAMASPVIANGYVWVGTNNESPRDPEQKQPASVLMCFRESDGAFVWQYVVPVREGTRYDTYFTGIKCSPLIEGNRLWLTTQGAEVICLDIGPLQRGDGTPSVLWRLDLAEELGVFVHPRVMGWTGANSVALLDRWIFVNTDNGVDMSHVDVPFPFSPSLVCLDKETGRLVWEDASPGERIFHVQWSSPLALTLDGQPRVFAGFGDGWLRAFAAATGEKLWELDCNPPEYRTNRYPHPEGPSEILASPVFHAGRIYVAIGQEPEHGEGRGNLVCVDARTGALVWQNQTIHRSISSVVVTEHYVYACDFSGFVYGLAPATGQIEWRLDAGCHIWASPLVVGSRLYLGDDDADAMVIDLDRVAARTRTATRPVLLKKEDLAREGIGPGPDGTDELPLGWVNSMASQAPLNAAPAFASGVLYWNIGGYLCAIADSASVPALTALSLRPPRLDAVFVPTPQDVVKPMLELAEVTAGDQVVDLGSGDGRVVITAAREYGSRAVGYELDAVLVERSRRAVQEQGLDRLARIEERDLFTADLSQADVVVVFLPASLLQRLGPQLARLRPGARVLSHEFLIPGLPPAKTVRVKSTEDQAEHTIHLWIAPLAFPRDPETKASRHGSR